MKQYSHGWLALKAIERLEKAHIPGYRQHANELVRWLREHSEGVIEGAWFPDEIFKDNANSHVLKLAPARKGPREDLDMPPDSAFHAAARKSPLFGKPYVLADPKDNLPARCEAWAHSVVDHLKIQRVEGNGSPISSSDNHVALGLFILSHYVADGHVPLHCDIRPFSDESHLHGKLEGAWEREVQTHYQLDKAHQRFICGPDGSPLRRATDYSTSFLKIVDDGLSTRSFSTEYGDGNTCVQDYMRAVCRCSYLLSYRFVPQRYDEKNVDMEHWRELPDSSLSYDELSPLVFSEAIDAIARIWLRTWCRYTKWEVKKRRGAVLAVEG